MIVKYNNIIQSLQIGMEEVFDYSEDAIKKTYKPDPKLLCCPICSQVFDKPTTLACGHSFCHQQNLRKQGKQGYYYDTPMSAMSVDHLAVVLDQVSPLGTMKENVALSALVSRYSLKKKQQTTTITLPPQCEAQFHIMIECASNNNTLLPHCFTQIVFATAFIDQILQQQSQSNLVVLRWPGAQEGIGIAGRLMRPQTYHYLMNASRYETVYKATFQGKQFVKLLDWQQLDLKVSTSGQYIDSTHTTAPLILCQVEERKAINPLSIEQFRPFFEIYDKLNNPVYLRQIAQLVDQKILHDRTNPEKLIYCVLRLLRLNEREISSITKTMDDKLRWIEIEDFLIKNASRSAVEIIKIDIPGNYPHALVFALLLLMIVFHYMAK